MPILGAQHRWRSRRRRPSTPYEPLSVFLNMDNGCPVLTGETALVLGDAVVFVLVAVVIVLVVAAVAIGVTLFML